MDTAQTVHVVHRCALEGPCRWQGYVIGYEASAEARALPEVRYELEQRLVAQLARWPRHGLIEHTEHALGEGLWVREAMDERVPERAHTTRVVLETLGDQRLRARLAALPGTEATGGIVLACASGDTLGWIVDQHDGRGTLIVATAVTNHRLWWNALAPAGQADVADLPVADLPVAGSLTGLGLATREATIDDWMAATDCGRLVTLAPVQQPPPPNGR